MVADPSWISIQPAIRIISRFHDRVAWQVPSSRASAQTYVHEEETQVASGRTFHSCEPSVAVALAIWKKWKARACVAVPLQICQFVTPSTSHVQSGLVESEISNTSGHIIAPEAIPSRWDWPKVHDISWPSTTHYRRLLPRTDNSASAGHVHPQERITADIALKGKTLPRT